MSQLNRALIRLLANPSFSTGLMWSSIIHVSTIVAAIVWPSAMVDNASLSGKKNVIEVEFTEQRSEPTVRVQTAVAIETAIQKTRTDADLTKPRVSEVAMAAFREPRQSHSQRKQIPESKVIKRETAKPIRLQRQTTDAEPTVSLVAIPAVAGTDDKTPPDLSGNRPPTYPPEAIRRRLEGTTMLRIHIAASGRVTRVEIAQSSGHQILDNAALNAVRSWRGQPARTNGKAVSTVERMPVRFKLK